MRLNLPKVGENWTWSDWTNGNFWTILKITKDSVYYKMKNSNNITRSYNCNDTFIGLNDQLRGFFWKKIK